MGNKAVTVTETQVERELATAGDWAVSPVSLAAVYRSRVRSEHRGLDEDGITEIKVVVTGHICFLL